MRIKLKSVSNIFWALSLFCYFFQFYFSNLSRFIDLFLFCFLLIELILSKYSIYDNQLFDLYLIFLLYLSLNSFISVINGESISNIVRFYLILAVIPVFSVLKNNGSSCKYDIFIFLSVIKSLVIIGIAIYLILEGNHTIIRAWAKSSGAGDIYFDSYYHIPKVQVHGNGILPMAYIISNKLNYNKFFRVAILAGVLCAGNMAFILCIALYYFYIILNLISKSKHKEIYFVLFFVILIIFAIFAFKTISLKLASSNSVVRLGQFEFLTDTNPLFGSGLGHSINLYTSYRTYSSNLYYELQTLYIFNQIGMVGLILFYMLIFISVYYSSGNLGVIFLLIYLIYTFFNPYCFDTTEMYSVYLIANLSFGVINENNSVSDNF